MGIITETNLKDWVEGDERRSQGIFPKLISDLIMASCSDLTDLRFPSGNAINQPGEDGRVLSKNGYQPYLPKGISYFEIGTNTKATEKLKKDYEDATNKISEKERINSTLVLVTPFSAYSRRSLGKIESWVQTKRKERQWKNIKVLEGTQLTDWINLFPGVLWDTGIVPNAMIDQHAKAYWESLSKPTLSHLPELTTDIFLASRNNECRKLQSFFSNPDGFLEIGAEYPENVANFVCAYIMSLSENQYQYRTIIIKTPCEYEKYKKISISSRCTFVLRTYLKEGDEPELRTMQQNCGVIYPVKPENCGNTNYAFKLKQPTKQQIVAKLEKFHNKDEVKEILEHLKRNPNLIALNSSDVNVQPTADSPIDALPSRASQNIDKRDDHPMSTTRTNQEPQWTKYSPIDILLTAQLVGCWNDKSEIDRKFIEDLSQKSYTDFIRHINEALNEYTDLGELIKFNQSKATWEVNSYEIFRHLGRSYTDDILERFKDLTIKALSAKDSALDLPKDKRLLKSVYEKEGRIDKRNSSELREGISDSLVLLSCFKNKLTSCSHQTLNSTVKSVVFTIFKSNSMVWASLNDVLPQLAEATPDTFIDAATTAADKKIFIEVFKEEGDYFEGGSFTTGLLWALELLAWSKDHLIRVCKILTMLSEQDPGGLWENRPMNSLIAILHPQFRHTTAKSKIRHKSFETITRENKEIAWKIASSYLYSNTGGWCLIAETHKPKWRDFIPDNWNPSFSRQDFLEEYIFYANNAIELAGTDVDKLLELLQNYSKYSIESNFSKKVREKMTSKEVLKLPEEDRTKLYEGLTNKIAEHRRYSDSPHYKISDEQLKELEQIAGKLEPSSDIQLRGLFSNTRALLDGEGTVDEQYERLWKIRSDAITKNIAKDDFNNLMSLWQSVDKPQDVGSTIGQRSSEPKESLEDKELFKLCLNSNNDADQEFINNYIWCRFDKYSWDWVGSIDMAIWNEKMKAIFLAALPFRNDVWKYVNETLHDKEYEYWKIARPLIDRNHEELAYAVDRLIINDRPDAALYCLWVGANEIQENVYPELAYRSLEAWTPDHLKSPNASNSDLNFVITKLQSYINSDTDLDRLINIEITFYNLLRYRRLRPIATHKKLADDPSYFYDVIKNVFSPTDKDKQKINNENKEDLLNQLERQVFLNILREWKHPPGRREDGSYDSTSEESFEKWLKFVQSKCVESGHWNIASEFIGKVIYYIPRKDEELWPDKICELVDSRDYEECLLGLELQIYNSRGVFTNTQGQEERKLADKWEKLSDLANEKDFIELSARLRDVSSRYLEQAERDKP